MVMPLLESTAADPEWAGAKGKGAKTKSLLQFVDPVTMTTAGSGFEVRRCVTCLSGGWW